MTRPAAVIIVGGGSAGAVLAARLSEDRSRDVLLVEAGQSFAPDGYPPALTDAKVVGSPDFDWHYTSEEPGRPGIAAPRGRVLGGSSAVNGTVAIRALPSDFARWTARGIDGWSWDDVLPVFKALENNPVGDERWHGRAGPFPIRQRTIAELSPSSRAFVDAARSLGLNPVEDFNSDAIDGAGPYSLNVVDGVRMNTGMTYLTSAVRARPNLTIRGNAEVDAVVLEGRRVTGIRLTTGEVLTGGHVVLSAGAFGSPAILMRSGIGPAAHLADLDIPVIADLPVGVRLLEHPFCYNVIALKPEWNAMQPAAGALVWTGSENSRPGDLDLQISATHFFDPKDSPTGGAIVLAAAVTSPRSSGSLRLASRDPRVPPHIHYGFLADPSDLDRMVEVVRLTRRIVGTQPFAGMVDSEIFPNPPVTDAELRDHIMATVSTYAHPTSTVPMGSDGDPAAVVDGRGRVRSIDGLHVVDASIFPEIPSVPTNVTTIMVAERLAGRLGV